MALTISDDYNETTLIVRPVGRLDTTTAKTLENHLTDHISDGQTQIVIDLEKVDYVSSYGLRVILIIAKKLMPHGQSFALCNLSDNVFSVFEVSGFGKILKIKNSLDEALAAIS